MNASTLKRRLLAVYSRATPDNIAAGRQWYRTARKIVLGLAHDTGHTASTAAGVVAATSPRMHWGRNVAVSRTLLSGGNPSGVFKASISKALAIIGGARPLSVLGGVKVRAFYRAILGDRTAAVVDTWILHAAGLLTWPGDRILALLRDALAWVAGRVASTTAEVQATIWVVARGRAH